MSTLFDYQQWRTENTKKKTQQANRKLIKMSLNNTWSHLNGKQLPVNGNSKAPPYKASENSGMVATGIDGKEWTSNGQKWVRL